MEQRGFLLLLRLIKHHHFGVATQVCYRLDPSVLLSYVKASSVVYRFLERNNSAPLKQMHAMVGKPMPPHFQDGNHLKWWHAIWASRSLPVHLHIGPFDAITFDNSVDYGTDISLRPCTGLKLVLFGGGHCEDEDNEDKVEQLYSRLGTYKICECIALPISIAVKARKYLFDFIVHHNCGLDPKQFKRVTANNLVLQSQLTLADGSVSTVRRTSVQQRTTIHIPDAPIDDISYVSWMAEVDRVWARVAEYVIQSRAYAERPEMGIAQYIVETVNYLTNTISICVYV